jgi:DNA-binding SARP family transcriptional activator
MLLKKTELNPTIESVLVEAYEFYKLNKFVYNKTQAAFHLADYYYRTNNFAQAQTYLSEALSTAREKEYTSYLVREFIEYRYLFDFASANNVHSDFIKLLADFILDEKNEGFKSKECRIRLNENNRSIYDISIYTFGKAKVVVRGQTIEDEQWQKKKWKLIFIYLVLNKNKQLSKDKILDLFYPDTPLESVDNIFHQMVSKFRNLIKLNNTSKTSEKNSKSFKVHLPFVIYEDKLLKVNNDLLLYIDSGIFDKYYRLSLSEKEKVKKIYYLTKGVDAYRGEFLEGNYESWCEDMRTNYRSYFTSMSEELIKLLFESQNFTETINYAENLLKNDKLNLTAGEYLIRSFEHIDKKKLAKERYCSLAKEYETEYGETLPASFTERIKLVIA